MRCPRCWLQAIAFFSVASGSLAVAVTGWLGEFYMLKDNQKSCSTGIDDVVMGALPNLTRSDITFEFRSHDSFELSRCGWGPNAKGKRQYSCRSSDQAWERFVARWSGYINIANEGDYQFELDVDGGARLTIGHNDCPGYSCATWDEVMNTRAGDLTSSFGSKGFTFADRCSICEKWTNMEEGMLCWATDNGCEPFGRWQLDADTSPCDGTQKKKVRGNRWLRAGSHPVKLEYFVRGGKARLFLRYKGPDTMKKKITVPSKAMTYPQIGGLFADWFTLQPDASALPALGLADGKSQFMKREVHPTINQPVGSPLSEELMTLASESMEEGIQTVYALRWSGFLRIFKPGDYKFRLTNDDGSRLYIGGAGRAERLLINNDGLLEFMVAKEAKTDLNKGLHAVRVEYFFKFGHSDIMPSPSGMIVEYNGPDSDLDWMPMTNLQATNPDCRLTYFEWRGLSLNTDCEGTCMDDKEFIVGDYVCDKKGGTYNLMCDAWDYDLADCEPPRFDVVTTPRPEVTCYVDSPSSEFNRRNVGKCKESIDGYCVEAAREVCEEEDPTLCKYQRCCTAQLRNVPFWGTTCIAFGANYSCEETLAIKVHEMEQTFTLKTDGPLEAKLLVDCVTDNCNAYPDTFEINELTGAPTDTPTCPDVLVPDEREDKGVDCYEGPWGLTGVRDPDYLCQNKQWNFCRNTKTWDGKPFQRCCSYIYVIKSVATAVCRFKGVAHGTCDDYLARLTLELNKWPSQEIDMGETVMDCNGDGCNGPEEMGCPSAIIYDPVIIKPDQNKTAALPVTSEGPKKEGLPTENLVIIIVGVCIVLGILFAVWRSMQPPPDRNLWHSESAKQVSDCWIEPEKDAEVGMPYGCVKPKPSELRLLEASEKPRQDTRPVGVKRIAAMEAALEREKEEVEGIFQGRRPSKVSINTASAEEEEVPEASVEERRPTWPQALADGEEAPTMPQFVRPLTQLALPGAVPTGATTPGSSAATTLENHNMQVGTQPPKSPSRLRQPPAAARSKRNGVAPVPMMNTMTLQELDTGYRQTVPSLSKPPQASSMLSLTDPKVFEQPAMPALADAPPVTAAVS